MWDALLSAVKSDPSSQIPPLYVLNDGDSGEALYANQRFVQEFLERWEEVDTHTITVQGYDKTVRTFRARQEFWRHLMMIAESIVPREKSRGTDLKYDVDERLTVRTDKPILPTVGGKTAHPIGELKLLPQQWSKAIVSWNQLQGERGEEQFIIDDVEEAPIDHQLDEMAVMDLLPRRPRAQAILDPSSTMPDPAELYQKRWKSIGDGNRPGGKSKYFTHFMKHWKLLEAQYRNYL